MLLYWRWSVAYKIGLEDEDLRVKPSEQVILDNTVLNVERFDIFCKKISGAMSLHVMIYVRQVLEIVHKTDWDYTNYIITGIIGGT